MYFISKRDIASYKVSFLFTFFLISSFKYTSLSLKTVLLCMCYGDLLKKHLLLETPIPLKNWFFRDGHYQDICCARSNKIFSLDIMWACVYSNGVIRRYKVQIFWYTNILRNSWPYVELPAPFEFIKFFWSNWCFPSQNETLEALRTTSTTVLKKILGSEQECCRNKLNRLAIWHDSWFSIYFFFESDHLWAFEFNAFLKFIIYVICDN